jgi:hypothetical protein
LAPRGDGRWRSTRAVWFSSTATSWPPGSFSCRGLPAVVRPSFSVAAALSDDRVPASVQNPRSHFSQRSDRSISSSCLSRSVNSIARRRNWRATAARRCSSSARRSSRPLLCASVCMVGAPRGMAEVADTRQCAAGALTWPARAATDSTIDKQPTPARDRTPRQRYRPTGSVPADARVAHLRMPWSAALAPRVCTPWCPRRHFTGHRLVAVPWGDGLRDKF